MKSVLVAALFLSLGFETCAVDDTPGQGSANLTKCTETPILSGDGTNCLTVTVSNPMQGNSGSSMTVAATFQNGSKSTVVIGPGSSHTFTCNITQLTAHETAIERSTVNWSW